MVDPGTGDLTLIAVSPDYRRQGIGTILLKKAIGQMNYGSLKIVTTDTNCSSISEFLKYHSIEAAGQQFEMMKTL